jgi:DNA helicase-2/ATP-dependent DNA helicase PcrA
MTRAKDQLSLIVPHRFYTHGQSRTGDQHLYASRSRFIPAGLAGEFEVCAWPAATQLSTPAQARQALSVDLAARMRGRWRTGT